MSLFSKTEVNKSMLPFIENGEGGGVVKVNGYGKASARMESYKIIFDSYEGKNPIIESVSAITYLSYKKGNFISEPKLEIGISHKKYILSGVDNNDDELETFYRTILDVKNLEKDREKKDTKKNKSRHHHHHHHHHKHHSSSNKSKNRDKNKIKNRSRSRSRSNNKKRSYSKSSDDSYI